MDEVAPHDVVADALVAKEPAERAAYARQLLAYVSAALAIEIGPQQASVDLYRIADHMVTIKP